MPTHPTIRQGSSGSSVIHLQDRLRAHIGDTGKSDGIFGPRTEGLVEIFQGARSLTQDGIVGPKTWEALEKPTKGETNREALEAEPDGAVVITDSHWLNIAQRQLIEGGSQMSNPRFLVIHFTSGASALSSINFWRTPAAKGASAQLVIDRDGTIYQCRPFNRTCGHAGKSKWKGVSDLNSCSIGIEIANAGDDSKLAARWTKLPLVKARHKNGGPLTEWEAYPEAQYLACETVAKVLVEHYGLEDVIGHEDIAPKRKVDPGPAFPMGRLRLACGFPEKITP